jgi:hypothetical protein
VIILLTIFRRILFVEPVIQSVIQKSKEEDETHV